MPKIEYEWSNFREDTLAIIYKADEICQEYAAMGYDLTLRQLYYQFVARDIIPNNQKSYDRLGRIVADGRMNGMIDWDHIVDRTRNLMSLAHWDKPEDLLDAAARQYRTEKWASQPNRVEAWIEKDALVGVLETACTPLDVAYFSCRGYTSASEIWGAAQRLREYIVAGQNVTILHLGDHDPSGIDMTRDIRERLEMFISADLSRENDVYPTAAAEMVMDQLTIKRIALNMNQVQAYNPPPNPAKFTDARFASYVELYGRECWELDALPPDILTGLIQSEILALRDEEAWAAALAAEQSDKLYLKQTEQRWTEVKKLHKFLDQKAS